MSIASEVTALGTNLQAAKNAVVAKGGTVGNTGLAGLAAEIGTISGGGGQTYAGPYGAIEYCQYSVEWNIDYAFGYDGIFSAEISDQSRLEQFLQEYPSDQGSSIYFQYTSSSYGGHDAWEYYYFDGQDYQYVYFYNDDELYDNTGIKVTWELEEGQQKYDASINISKRTNYFPNVTAGVRCILTADEFAQLGMSNISASDEILGGIPAGTITKYTSNTGVTSFPQGFLRVCSELKAVDLSSCGTVATVTTDFLSGCRKLNAPLTLPNGVTKIENGFMSQCSEFNQPLTIPNGVTTIGNAFMSNCGKFDSALTLPNTVTRIGDDFLRWGTKFNQPLTLPENLISIGNYFLCGGSYNTEGSFNQPLVIPNRVESIGNEFLGFQLKFNSSLTLSSSLKTIGNRFLSVNYAGKTNTFAQPLTLPSSITSIDHNFMYNNKNFVGPLTVETSAIPASPDRALSTQYNNVPMYTTGITIKGSKRSAWMAALPNRTSSPFRKLIDGGA